jgi:hypothetical protein
MGKHTKGPWEVDHEEKDQLIISRADIDWTIATCYCDPVSEETRANARLIAASPEMYDLLREILVSDVLNGDTLGKINELLNRINK